MTPSRVGAATRLVAVIGSPVRHSRSPAIHNAAFEAAGDDWVMVALDVAPGDAVAAVEGAAALGFGGLAVTMPHKTDAMAACDELTERAQRVGAINTVAFADGRIVGDSTDGAGFVDALSAAGVSVAGQRFLVIGAGGAARSVVAGVADGGATAVTVAARRVEAAAVAARGAGGVDHESVPLDDVDDLSGFDVIVNATPVGMAGGPPGLPDAARAITADHVVADLVYHPLDTPLLGHARQVGATAVDGLGMLVHQAAHQQRRWLRRDPDIAAMQAAARNS